MGQVKRRESVCWYVGDMTEWTYHLSESLWWWNWTPPIHLLLSPSLFLSANRYSGGTLRNQLSKWFIFISHVFVVVWLAEQGCGCDMEQVNGVCLKRALSGQSGSGGEQLQVHEQCNHLAFSFYFPAWVSPEAKKGTSQTHHKHSLLLGSSWPSPSPQLCTMTICLCLSTKTSSTV